MNALHQCRIQTRLWLGILAIASPLLIGCAAGGVYRQTDVGVAGNEQYTDYSIDELDSYGVCYALPPYGRVWRPNVVQDWRPFYHGHWDYTEPTWTWVSYEPFGWIVYHYGNWVYTPEYGWVWIPDNAEWSPATVEWMYYGDFVCWAPLPPRGVIWPRPWERFEQGINVWNVVHAKDLASDNVGERRLVGSIARPDEQHVQIFNRFPDPKMIEQQTGQPNHSVKIERTPVTVGKQQLHKMRVPQSDQQRAEKYRPQVESRVTRRSGEHR
jgi:hypothetical protein